jgi:hypothetical protein
MPFQNLKFQVENKEQATALQEWLFSQGYKWVSGHDGKPKYLEEKYFICYVDGTICYLFNSSSFAEHKYKEMKLEFSYKLSVKSAEIIHPFKYIIIKIDIHDRVEKNFSLDFTDSDDYGYTFDLSKAEYVQKELSKDYPENHYQIISIPNK